MFLIEKKIAKYDKVLLQFMTARLITNYNNLTIAWLLQFTTGSTIYDDCYYNLRQVLQFTKSLEFTTVAIIYEFTPPFLLFLKPVPTVEKDNVKINDSRHQQGCRRKLRVSW